MCDCGRPLHRDLDVCFRCKCLGLNIAPSATPSRTPQVRVTPRENNNAWERGIATDERGMPYLDKNLSPIGLKELADNRHQIESQLRKLKNESATAQLSKEN